MVAAEALKKLSEQYWNFLMESSPTSATFYGDHRFDHELERLDEKSRTDHQSQYSSLLNKLNNIKASELSESDKITYEALSWKLSQAMESYEYKEWECTLDHL